MDSRADIQTIAIELLRLGTPYNYNLSGDHKYVALCGTHPSIEFSITCDQITFNKQIRLLRYDNINAESRERGILFFQELIAKIYNAIKPLGSEGAKIDDWLHLRMIITPKELSQLPFELALTPEGFRGSPITPLLLNAEQRTTLTREVRQMTTTRYVWPSRPRILYAWANPNNEVPHQEHFAALREVIKPLAPPFKDNEEPISDISGFITICKKASLQAIKKEVETGLAAKAPYTHVHLLAHGSKVKDEDSGTEEYKMVLHDATDTAKAYYANGNELAAALLADENQKDSFPAIVSLMTCDSGHNGSIISPSGSLAHELHEAGIPCVFASQFPLSIPGSVKLVACLYKYLLLESEDPRKALYQARVAIQDNLFHDWASLVAYVRLPEDIDLQLQDTKLRAMFASMDTSNKWTDHVLKFQDKINPEKINQIYADVTTRLDNSLSSLLNCVKNGYSTLATAELKAEHLGLLGSGYKRKSEHLFRMAQINLTLKIYLLNEAKDCLNKAKDFYYKGFDAQPSSHWNAMQYLSLKAVLDGTLATEGEIWTVIKFMAEKIERSAKEEKERAWSWGTLAELYLLKALTEPITLTSKIEAIDKAKEYISKIKIFNAAAVIESTKKQLERYIHWWPAMYPDTYRNELMEIAIEVRNGFFC